MDVFTRDNEECTAFVFSMTAGYLKPLQVDPFVCDLHNVGYTIYLDATSTVFFFFHAFPVTPKECCIMPLYSRMGEKNTTSWSKILFCCQICEILANGNAKLLT